MEKIYNKCRKCGKEIYLIKPPYIDKFLLKALKESTVSICHNCDTHSEWKRVET